MASEKLPPIPAFLRSYNPERKSVSADFHSLRSFSVGKQADYRNDKNRRQQNKKYFSKQEPEKFFSGFLLRALRCPVFVYCSFSGCTFPARCCLSILIPSMLYLSSDRSLLARYSCSACFRFSREFFLLVPPSLF